MTVRLATDSLLALVLFAGISILDVSTNLGQTDSATSDSFVVRAYRVDDILRTANNYEFTGISFPGLADTNRIVGSAAGGGFGGGGFGGGRGGGGGLGGGAFRIPAQPLAPNGGPPQLGGGNKGGGGFGYVANDANSELSIDDIASAIESLIESVDTEAWEQGNITQLGSTLIIRTKQSVHEQIIAYLKLIRENVSTTSRSVTVKANWLLITKEDYEKLEVESKNGLQVVNRAKVDSLTKTTGGSGTLSCFNGQTVHIVSGNLKNWLKSVVPVVGENLLRGNLRQQLAALEREGRNSHVKLIGNRTVVQDDGDGNSGSNRIGYQPVNSSINYGALLQVTPMLVPDEDAAIIDVHSTVVLPTENKTQGTTIVGVMTLDRIDVLNQQFKASLRVPLNQPVVVGGSTLQIGVEKPRQLYLVLEVVAGK